MPSLATLSLLSAMAGGMTTALEIIGARILSPAFGATTFPWASLIAVTLAGLAAGYRLGGRVADARPGDRFLLMKILLAASGMILLIPLMKRSVLLTCLGLGLKLGSLLAGIILFFPCLTLFGMAVPAAIRLGMTDLGNAGRVSGTIFASTTFGGIIGTLGASFLLVPAGNLSQTVIILSLSLSTGILIFSFSASRTILTAGATIAAAGLTILLFAPASLDRTPGLIAFSESRYTEIAVIDNQAGRSMLLNGIVQGRVTTDGSPADPYFSVTDRLIAAYHAEPQRALVIGLGTGILPRRLEARGITTDVVEIDAAVAAVAAEYFGYRRNSGSLMIEDARPVVARSRGSYDVVILDAYAAESIPYHLFSQEAFREISDSLRKNGMLAINMHDFSSSLYAEATNAVAHTLRTVFPAVFLYEIDRWGDGRFRNISIICLKEARQPFGTPEQPGARAILLPAPDRGMLLTDDLNPIDHLFTPVAEGLRSETIKAFGSSYPLP